jgi:spore maturation protein CgeB
MYPYRVRQIERLIEAGVPIRIYGPPFPRWIGRTVAESAHTGKHVSRNEKAMMFRSAAGVLNTMFPAEMYGANGRLFQAAGSGAAVLTEYRSEIPKLFSEGDEVLVYRSFDELVMNAVRLLSEDGLTASIGDAAAVRAHREHTYAQRMATILDKIL